MTFCRHEGASKEETREARLGVGKAGIDKATRKLDGSFIGRKKTFDLLCFYLVVAGIT